MRTMVVSCLSMNLGILLKMRDLVVISLAYTGIDVAAICFLPA
jgi:hypothetical protein